MAPKLPLVAYRAWRVEGGKLASPHVQRAGVGWMPRADAVAHCVGVFPSQQGTHRSPDFACRCGLYGYYHLAGALRREGAGLVFGAFLAFGRVIRHEYGLRAEKGRIIGLTKNLIADDEGIDEARRMAALHEVPFFEDWRTLEAYAGKQGVVLADDPGCKWVEVRVTLHLRPGTGMTMTRRIGEGMTAEIEGLDPAWKILEIGEVEVFAVSEFAVPSSDSYPSLSMPRVVAVTLLTSGDEHLVHRRLGELSNLGTLVHIETGRAIEPRDAGFT